MCTSKHAAHPDQQQLAWPLVAHVIRLRISGCVRYIKSTIPVIHFAQQQQQQQQLLPHALHRSIGDGAEFDYGRHNNYVILKLMLEKLECSSVI